MIRVLLARLLELVPTLLVISALAFAMSAALGDPVAALLGSDADPALHAATAHALGLDQPWPQRYLGFVWHAAHGDFGMSWHQARPVATLLRERLPASFELTACAAVIAVALGVPLGSLLAVAPRASALRVGNVLAVVVSATPPFLLGLLLIEAFAVHAAWLPAFGRGQTVSVFGWSTGLLTASGRRALVLPALTLGLFQAAVLARVARAEMEQALASRPIRFALARGLPLAAVRRQAWRQTVVPLITVVIPQIGGMLAFAVVTESVFRWPGLGALLIQSIAAADVPVVAACLLLAGLTFGLLSLLADALAVLIDPRLRAITSARR